MVHHKKHTSLPALCKLVQSIDSWYWEWQAEVAHETHQPMGKHDSQMDPKHNSRMDPKHGSRMDPKHNSWTDPKPDQQTGKTTEPQPKACGNPTEALKMGPD